MRISIVIKHADSERKLGILLLGCVYESLGMDFLGEPSMDTGGVQIRV